MARIFQFPTPPRMRARQANSPGKADARRPNHDAGANPILQILLGLILFVAICTWPIFRWLLFADLMVQVLRMVFLSGWGSFAAFLHILFVCVVAYLMLVMAPASPK